jgi:hypothetical protein
MSAFTALRKRSWLLTLALLAFTLRALIPVGFMPSGEGWFGVQICPEGLSAQALAVLDPHAAHHHHHDHQSWASGHCPFAAIASAPPISHDACVVRPMAIEVAAAVPDSVSVPERHRNRIAQPRGPPSLS